jgi:hypothetical protein
MEQKQDSFQIFPTDSRASKVQGKVNVLFTFANPFGEEAKKLMSSYYLIHICVTNKAQMHLSFFLPWQKFIGIIRGYLL